MEKFFLSLMSSNNAEIERLIVAVREQTIYCVRNPDDVLARDLCRRFISALELAVLAGYRIKQIQNIWDSACRRVPAR